MKKLTKILSIVMIVMMMLSTFSTVFAAIGYDPDSWTGQSDTIDSTQVNGFMNSVINIVSMVGSGVAIIAIIVLGIKYMMGSAEEKAEYKKTLLPYVFGAVMVFGASLLTKFIYGLVNK